MKHGFTSAFATDLEDYLAFKEAMGFTGTNRAWYLKQFDAYAAYHNLNVFDRVTVEGWVRQRLATCGTYRSWMSYIRDFGRWVATHRDSRAYMLDNTFKAPFVRAQPFLLTSAQIDAFFTAAATITARSPWAWQAVAFFTLMCCCGLRTAEVRALACQDVDLKGQAITIIASKGRRSRRLPLTAEVVGVLHACDQITRKQFPARDTFFVSSTRAPVDTATVCQMFRRIWDQAGLPRPTSGPRPRPYDFRHHFAYANLERWMANGTDIEAMLPYLSVYMGHATIDSTYYYIHTSPDFLAAYNDITAATNQTLLPPVGFE